MIKKNGYWLFVFALMLVVSYPVHARQEVTLALKWYHQFQFAGYYAALEQGYYDERGLDVSFITPEDGDYPVQAVLEGRAQYGVSSADLIPARTRGEPLVVLAPIFQHSPIILLSLQDRNLRYLTDYIGRRIMVSGDDDLPEVLAMFIQEGIDPENLYIVPHTWTVDSLINGDVDASVDYITNEPNQLSLRGHDPHVIRPIDYGIDFYADSLFTTEEELRHHPQRARAFREASLLGWEYALSHVEEMVDHILDLPGVAERGVSRQQLLYEASTIHELVQPVLVELGHNNPLRWERMAETYARFGLIPEDYSLEGFLYDPDQAGDEVRINMALALAMILGVFGILGIILFWNWQLRVAVRGRTREIAAARSYLQDVLDSSTDVVFVIDTATGQIRDANRSVLDVYGYSRDEVLGLSPRELSSGDFPFDGEEAQRRLDKARDQGPQSFDWRSRRKDGSLFWSRVSIKVSQVAGESLAVVLVQDTSGQKAAEAERARLQEELAQSRKLEAVGRLAGGIAHDFNNMLGVILGQAELGLMESASAKQGSGLEARSYLEEIQGAALRSADLTRQLLAFARKQPTKPQLLDLNEQVEHILKLLSRLMGANLDLIWEPGKNLPPIMMDPVQLEQALTNLCLNARDAVDPQGGKIHLWSDHQAGSGQVTLGVRDNGSGMTPEIQQKIFEPFYTTKELGQGTGLGLAMVLGIMEQNGGHIRVESTPGKGTTMMLSWPQAGKPGEKPEGNQIQEPIIGLESSGQNRLILLVEDESSIRVLTQRILESLGFAVLSAEGPQEALKLWAATREKPALLLTDVAMPGMNGWQLCQRLRQDQEELPCLFISGHGAEILDSRLGENPLDHFLAKPFKRGDLVKALGEALGETLGG